jgi:hypothetical protein
MGCGASRTVCTHVVRVLLAPLSTAVPALLTVVCVVLYFDSVIFRAPAPLAVMIATHALVRVICRRLECSATVWTIATVLHLVI